MEANREVKPISLLTRQKSLIYTTAMSYADYLSQSASRELLAVRGREVRLLPEDQAYLSAYPDVVHWLIVISDESPDTVAVLPVLMRLAACCPRLDVRLVLDDDDNQLANVAQLVDDSTVATGLGDADYPLLLVFDEEWQYQDQWGPHPSEIEPFWDAWLAEHPEFEQLSDDESPAAQRDYEQLLDDLTQAMRLWYNSELANAAGAEIRSLLVGLREGSGDDDGADGDDQDDDDDA